MPCFGLLLQPSFGFARAHGVDADRMERTEDTLRFWHNGAVVYSIPAKYVKRVETFAERTEALEWLRTQGRSGGGRGVLGNEATASRGPARSAVIEHVSVVLEERGKTKP
jgi:hypothetical protein